MVVMCRLPEATSEGGSGRANRTSTLEITVELEPSG